MPSTLRKIDGDAPIAPDIVPADWADCVPTKPASDAISREKLFAEIRHAAETVAPKVDNTFRATDVNDTVVLDPSSRAWIKRAGAAFVFALIGVVGAAVWQNHGDAATQAVANLVPAPGASTSPTAEPAEPAAQPANAVPDSDPFAAARSIVPADPAAALPAARSPHVSGSSAATHRCFPQEEKCSHTPVAPPESSAANSPPLS